MRITCISDLHGRLPAIPDSDLLLIAGDICPHAPHERVGGPADLLFQSHWLDTTFRAWLDDLPVKKTIATWGNHDWVAERRPDLIPALPCEFLMDAPTHFQGLHLYGTPWQPWFYDWAFNAPQGPAGETFLAEKYAQIPPNTDILISHGPPHGYGDRTTDRRHTGSKALADLLARLPLKLLVTGHIHESAGTYPHPSGCRIVNASVLDEHYRLVNPPIVFEL